jgi:hypothetical protein
VTAAVVAAAALAVSGWQTVVNPAAGFSISVPAGWQLVPTATATLRNRVVELRRAKRGALANQYAEIAAARRGASTGFPFQAFAWPPPKGPVVPDVTVKIDAVSTTLSRVAAEYVAALRKPAGAQVAPARAMRLPAGYAEEIAGSVPLAGSKTLRSPYTVFLLVRGRRLYSIAFRGGTDAGLFRRIAATFRWR